MGGSHFRFNVNDPISFLCIVLKLVLVKLERSRLASFVYVYSVFIDVIFQRMRNSNNN